MKPRKTEKAGHLNNSHFFCVIWAISVALFLSHPLADRQILLTDGVHFVGQGFGDFGVVIGNVLEICN